jgi:hypothetical protein
MNNELEGSNQGLIKVLSQNLPGAAEEDNQKSQNNVSSTMSIHLGKFKAQESLIFSDIKPCSLLKVN